MSAGDTARVAQATRMRHYRARTGRNPTARINLVALGALLATLDDAGLDAARVTLGDDVVRRARAARCSLEGHTGTDLS